MADEENPTATTEAAPEATAGPDTETKLEDLVTEGKVGVPAEQEAEKPEQEQEQETEPSFDEALEQAKGQIEGLKESDPEQYEKLSKVFGGEDIAAKTVALEQREAQLLAAAESQQAFATVNQAYDPAREESRGRMASFGNAVAQQINKAVQDAGGQPATSGPRLVAALQEEVDKAAGTGRATGLAESFLEARTAALTSTLGAQLTAEELTEISGLTWQDAVSNPQATYGKLFNIVLKAAVRAAPEEAVKQGVSKAKATKEAAELLANLTKTIPKNGKVQAAMGPSTKSAPTVAEYAAATAEQRRKWEAAGVEPIVD